MHHQLNISKLRSSIDGVSPESWETPSKKENERVKDAVGKTIVRSGQAGCILWYLFQISPIDNQFILGMVIPAVMVAIYGVKSHLQSYEDPISEAEGVLFKNVLEVLETGSAQELQIRNLYTEAFMKGEGSIKDVANRTFQISELTSDNNGRIKAPVGIMDVSRKSIYGLKANFQEAVLPFINLIQSLRNIGELGIIIHDTSILSPLSPIIRNPSLGLGETYMDGKWDHPDLFELYCKLLEGNNHSSISSTISNIIFRVRSTLENFQTRTRSKKVIEEHYDIQAKIYKGFLDKYMQYTSGFFGSPNITDISTHQEVDTTMSLEQAQINKMERICQKLDLQPGDTVLDIGGGWGGLARYMAETRGVKVEIVTLSGGQADHAEQEMCEGFDIKLHRCDYRDMLEKLDGKKFDKITCVGMLEHIGHKNIDNFFDIISQALNPGGRGLMHCIFSPQDTIMRDAFVEKHTFPEGELIPGNIIGDTLNKYFDLEIDEKWGVENWGRHYVSTLRWWAEKFKKIQGLSIREQRKWAIYFNSMAAGFHTGRISVGQWVFHSKEETEGSMK